MPQYHSIFMCVDYVKPMPPSQNGTPRGKLLVMGVHPISGGTLARYLAFRRSGQKWQRWVYSQIDELRECPPGPPNFTKINHTTKGLYSLPEKFVLVSPYGYSQVIRYTSEVLIDHMKKRHPKVPLFVLTDAATRSPMHINARSLSHLPQIIGWAHDFASINSAPAIIAAALGRRYSHFPQTNASAQDDTGYLSQNAEIV